MKKIFLTLFLCIAFLLGMLPFTVFAEDTLCTFEYLKRDVSTGDGYIVVEYGSERIELSGDVAETQIPRGTDVTVTIKANAGSAITAVAYDNAPMSFGDPAMELNMTIKNYSDNHSLKITYTAATFTCGVVSTGNGKVSILNPATDNASVDVLMGDNFEFYAEAEEGYEILSIRVNGEEIDLTKYGQTDVVKVARFKMELTEICEDTAVVVTFSTDKIQNTIKFGDVNKDNQVNVKDATMIQKFVADIIDFDKAQSAVGDVDADLRVSVKDATAIQKFVAGIINKFPAEK